MPKPTVLLEAVVPAPIRRHVGRAVETRQLGRMSADRGLDLLTFFVADFQTGFGPFIAVYLTASHWSAESIGQVLGIGSLVAIAAQVPTGALIDAVPFKRGAAVAALIAVMCSALLLALSPTWWPTVASEVLHGVASCLLVPAIAAISLSRVGRARLGERLGRNARYMALGSAIGAPLLGLTGSHLSPGAVFWVVALSTLPAIFALLALPPRHPDMPLPPRAGPRQAVREGARVLTDWRLLTFVLCVVLFHMSNAFMLPLASTVLQVRLGGEANLWLAACITGPQLFVAAISPWMGRQAEIWGRRPLLIAGFCLLPIRGVLLSLIGSPELLVAVQLLDGFGGAMFGVMQPLIAADITKGTNRFNLALGLLGLAAAAGAAVSSTGAGWVASHYGARVGFLALAAVGAVATLAVVLLLPETRGQPDPPLPPLPPPPRAAAGSAAV
jgi:MFS family permease